MRNRSIGFRLAAWYFLALAAAIAVFSAVAWFAMRASLYGAIDSGLRDRAASLATFLDVISSLPDNGMVEELQEHALPGQGGNLFQVRSQTGQWLFRSRALKASGVPLEPPADLPAPRFANSVAEGLPVRLYSQKVLVGQTPYAIQVAAVTKEAAGALESFRMMLLFTGPLLVLVASCGAYWISRRALAPVDQITRAAQRISAENLGDRLRVPQTRDELQRLSQTLNEMLSRLEGSVRRMSQFTADASHELRAPIALIRTTAEIAVRRNRTAEEYCQALDDILQESEQTSRVVDNLMLLARADSGNIQLQMARADLAAIVRSAAEAGETLAHANGLVFSTSLPAAPLPVHADSHAIRRVLLILMDNASKYTAAGGWIKVAAEGRDGCTVVSVADNGIGIAPADLPHIFDRFWLRRSGPVARPAGQRTGPLHRALDRRRTRRKDRGPKRARKGLHVPPDLARAAGRRELMSGPPDRLPVDSRIIHHMAVIRRGHVLAAFPFIAPTRHCMLGRYICRTRRKSCGTSIVVSR